MLCAVSVTVEKADQQHTETAYGTAMVFEVIALMLIQIKSSEVLHRVKWCIVTDSSTQPLACPYIVKRSRTPLLGLLDLEGGDIGGRDVTSNKT